MIKSKRINNKLKSKVINLSPDDEVKTLTPQSPNALRSKKENEVGSCADSIMTAFFNILLPAGTTHTTKLSKLK